MVRIGGSEVVVDSKLCSELHLDRATDWREETDVLTAALEVVLAGVAAQLFDVTALGLSLIRNAGIGTATLIKHSIWWMVFRISAWRVAIGLKNLKKGVA